MALEIRRVVTGHDKDGKAIVAIDDLAKKRLPRDVNSPNEVAVVWTTEGFPVDNTTTEDAGDRDTGITLSGGTVFRVLRLAPNNAQRVHRTDSIDYAVVMSGEVDMELEKGDEVHLKAGDVLVQRGTVHNWINRGPEPCQIAFILIDAKPVEVNGKVLEAHG
jgi:quercetin dioxygenase-like cupin family protein